jgi:hypothetical protein
MLRPFRSTSGGSVVDELTVSIYSPFGAAFRAAGRDIMLDRTHEHQSVRFKARKMNHAFD